MAAQKEKRKQFVSPVLEGIWPHLNGPDTKFKAAGEYHTKAAGDPAKDPKVQAFLDHIQGAFDTYVDEVKAEIVAKEKTEKLAQVKINKLTFNDPIAPEMDDEGNETGRMVVKFKMNASYQKKDGTVGTLKPNFFDAKGNPLVNPPSLGTGTKFRISYTIAGYNTPQGTGISLYLNAVQILEVAEYNGGGNASSYGFTPEDGYEGEAAAAGFGEESDAGTGGDAF